MSFGKAFPQADRMLLARSVTTTQGRREHHFACLPRAGAGCMRPGRDVSSPSDQRHRGAGADQDGSAGHDEIYPSAMKDAIPARS